MITPLEVYAVMQLDVIIEAIRALAIPLFSVTFLVLPLILSFFWIEGREMKEMPKPFFFLWAVLLYACCFFGGLLAFLPSTKTAAAMIILPAITSDEVVEPMGKEARELYELAKKVLRDNVGERAEDLTE